MRSDVCKVFVERMNIKMEEKALSKVDICKFLNIDSTTVEKWEEELPPLICLHDLGELFECSISYLLGEETDNANEV
ncbi:MAG: hypothetical protein R3Y63_08885 [Eubacteriales bacterium]